MAELAAYTNAPLFTAIPTAVAVVRGARYTLDASGTVALSAIGVRGDFVASQTAAASEPFAAFSLQNGSIIPMLATGALAVGDTVYSAASGTVSSTSTSAVLLGKAVTAASGSGILFEVLLENPA